MFSTITEIRGASGYRVAHHRKLHGDLLHYVKVVGFEGFRRGYFFWYGRRLVLLDPGFLHDNNREQHSVLCDSRNWKVCEHN